MKRIWLEPKNPNLLPSRYIHMKIEGLPEIQLTYHRAIDTFTVRIAGYLVPNLPRIDVGVENPTRSQNGSS